MNSSVIGLVNNAAFLLAVGLLYDILADWPRNRKQSLSQQILIGLFLAGVGIAIMLNPIKYGHGVIFDTRSVLLCITGFFFGIIPVTLVVLITSAFRLFLGGTGALTGVVVIIASGGIGLAWRYYRRGLKHDPGAGELYLLGIVVHLVMLAAMLLMPWKIAVDVLSKISLPVMIIFPATTVILGKLLVNREKRKRSEEKTQRSDTLQRKMFSNIRDVIVIIDQNGISKYKSPNVEALFGWKHEDIIDSGILENVHPEDLKAAHAFFDNLKNEPNSVGTMEFRYKCKDGSFKWIEFTGTNLLHDPEITGIIGNYHNITERRRAEVALRESEEKYRMLVENQTDMVVKVDSEGRFLFVSPSYCRIFGKQEEELLGQKFMPLVHEEDREATARAMKALDTQPHTAYIEQRAMTKDGWLWLAWADTAIFDSRGNIKEIIGVGRDITERKRVEEETIKLQEQLVQTHKMESVGRLAGGVAHDFNNMLSVILGYSELALDQLGDDQPTRSALQEIQRAANRSADLTRQLLAFARKQTVAPQILDMNATIENMLGLLRRLIGEDIELIWRPGNNLHSVKVDPSQIDQILANLCVNARDAIEYAGKITIETSNEFADDIYYDNHVYFLPGEYVLLTVSDNGCGMDRDTTSRLFEPFFTTKKIGSGTGLGLATTYGIVKQNNGFINVYSEPGHGTTFKIYLPRYVAKSSNLPDTAALPARPAPVEVESIIPHGRETILLVEDEPMILELSETMLEGLGYKVITAGTPGEAIRLAQEHGGQINLLMTDVIMPEMNGSDLARSLLFLFPDIKLLFMSGYTANVITHNGVLDEGVNFIQKPFARKDLAIKIREIFSQTSPVLIEE
jgi:PAS domain S-box-containing protein